MFEVGRSDANKNNCRTGDIILDTDILVELTTMPARATLAAYWTLLESRASAGFFLSWTWMATWLDTLPGTVRPLTLIARRQDRIVGLALLASSPDRTLPLIGGRGLWLHTTGQSDLDSIAIEHNGVLVDASESGVEAAMLSHLCRHMRPWRRVTLPHLRVTGSEPNARTCHNAVARHHDEPSWVVDLDAVRASANGYLGLLNSKARYAIRRTRAACEALGPIEVSVADSLPAAQRGMNDLLRLHAQRWQGRGDGSSFLTPFTQRFHARLFPAGFERGEIQILSVRVAGRPLGHVYSFVHRGRVSFYQSGFDYEMLGPKASPGLLTLALAIQHNAALGHSSFDLLGGAGHYKKDLATHQETLRTLVLERRGLRNSLEQQARKHLVPRLRRVSGDSQHWRIWLRNWLARIALAVSLPLLALSVDRCTGSTTKGDRAATLPKAPFALVSP